MVFLVFAIFSLHKNSSLRTMFLMKKIIYPPVILFLLVFAGYFMVSYLLPLRIPPLPSSTVFLDTDGQELGEVTHSGSVRHQEITYEEIPDFYKKSLVALEDKTFWTNNGISLSGLMRSMIHNIQSGKVVE